jgi:transcription antitermination factor NusG
MRGAYTMLPGQQVAIEGGPFDGLAAQIAEIREMRQGSGSAQFSLAEN